MSKLRSVKSCPFVLRQFSNFRLYYNYLMSYNLLT
jgi:hypothetical protein